MAAKLSLLEQELIDERQVGKRLEARLDDLLIRVGVLSKRIRGSWNPLGKKTAVGLPRLKVVKVSPGPILLSNLSKKKASEFSPRRRGKTLTERIHPNIEPKKITDKTEVSGIDSSGQDETAQVLAFNKAFDLYRANKFLKAAKALNEFALNYPDHSMAISAGFYAGKSQMLLHRIDAAERQFREVAQRYSGQDLSLEALLMVGKCQEKKGQQDKARSTYLHLVDAYPLSQQARTASLRLKSLR
jgi:TolA-binding protein